MAKICDKIDDGRLFADEVEATRLCCKLDENTPKGADYGDRYIRQEIITWEFLR